MKYMVIFFTLETAYFLSNGCRKKKIFIFIFDICFVLCTLENKYVWRGEGNDVHTDTQPKWYISFLHRLSFIFNFPVHHWSLSEIRPKKNSKWYIVLFAFFGVRMLALSTFAIVDMVRFLHFFTISLSNKHIFFSHNTKSVHRPFKFITKFSVTSFASANICTQTQRLMGLLLGQSVLI